MFDELHACRHGGKGPTGHDNRHLISSAQQHSIEQPTTVGKLLASSKRYEVAQFDCVAYFRRIQACVYIVWKTDVVGVCVQKV